MTTYEDFLLQRRFYDIMEILNRSSWLKEPYIPENLEAYDVALTGEFEDQVEFKDGSVLLVFERYSVANYSLLITHYAYVYSDPQGRNVFYCDNRPHHPNVWTFPHHKHYAHTDRIFPFSGDLSDVIAEIDTYIAQQDR